MGASQRPRGDPEAERRLIDHLDETLFQRKTAKLSAGDESPPKRDPVKGASSVRFLLRRLAVPPLEAPETRPSFPCPPAQPGRIGEQTMNNTKILTNGIIAGGIALFASLAPAAQNTKQQGYLNINGVGLSYTIKDGKASIDNCTLVLHNNGTTSSQYQVFSTDFPFRALAMMPSSVLINLPWFRFLTQYVKLARMHFGIAPTLSR